MEPIEEIKSKLDIVQFIQPYVPLKQAGRNYKGLCPFHGEKTPSFMVSPERQMWHCFGCQLGGDVIAFYQRIENLDFYEALQALAKQTGVTLRYQEPKETAQKKRLLEINMLVAKFYHYLLTEHKAGKTALDYLTAERKLLPKTIETFQLGYAPTSWDHLAKFLKKHNIAEQDAYKAGVVGRNTRGVYDYFRDRIMFPLHDHRGDIVGFAGRVFGSNPNQGAKYINSPETPVYVKGNTLYGLYQNASQIKDNKLVIMVEGEFDMLSSYQSGIKNVVAIKGTALTTNQINLIRRYAPTLVLALDQDSAGQEATKRSISLAQEAGLTVRIASLPFGKDVDEVAKSSPQALKNALANARPYYDWLLSTILGRHDLADPFEKKKAADEMIPVLLTIDNDIIKEHYFKQLAKALDSSYETLVKTARKLSFSKNRPSTMHANDKEKSEPHEVVVLSYLLTLLLQSKRPTIFLEDLQNVAIDRLPVLAETQLLKQFLASLEAEKQKFSQKAFLASLANELSPTVDMLLLAEVDQSFLTDEELLDKEITKTIRELKRLILQTNLGELRKNIASAGKDGRSLQSLNEQFEQLKAELKTVS